VQAVKLSCSSALQKTTAVHVGTCAIASLNKLIIYQLT
jgi:hypothetical protein